MGDIIHQVNSAPGGQYSLENSAWGTVFTSENCLGGHFLGGAKFPMTQLQKSMELYMKYWLDLACCHS